MGFFTFNRIIKSNPNSTFKSRTVKIPFLEIMIILIRLLSFTIKSRTKKPHSTFEERLYFSRDENVSAYDFAVRLLSFTLKRSN